MVAQREHLQQTLAGEHRDEDHVQVIEDGAERVTLLVVIEGHRQHVQPDYQHDCHIELLVRRYFEDDRLWPPLKA